MLGGIFKGFFGFFFLVPTPVSRGLRAQARGGQKPAEQARIGQDAEQIWGF